MRKRLLSGFLGFRIITEPESSSRSGQRTVGVMPELARAKETRKGLRPTTVRSPHGQQQSKSGFDVGATITCRPAHQCLVLFFFLSLLWLPSLLPSGVSHTFTISFPRFLPSNKRFNASGKDSKPSKTVSSKTIFFSLTSGDNT
jgi:hypothetical protein